MGKDLCRTNIWVLPPAECLRRQPCLLGQVSEVPLVFLNWQDQVPDSLPLRMLCGLPSQVFLMLLFVVRNDARIDYP